MSANEKPGEDILAIASRYLDGMATRDDVESMRATLEADADARRAFLELCELDSALAERALDCRNSDESIGVSVGTVRGRAIAVVAAVAAAVLVAFLWTTGHDAGGDYDDRALPVVTVAAMRDGGDGRRNRPLTPTTLRAGEARSLTSSSGADLELLDAAVFAVSARDEGALYGGGISARLPDPTSRFSVMASNLRVVDLGTAFRVDRIDDDHVAVTVLDGEVEVQSRVRLPVCYWPFDGHETAAGVVRVADTVGGLSAALGGGATPVAGLVGAGAVRFDGTRSAVARIEGGTGDHVGTGSLAMASGITIEAVIVSEWSGRFRDYDEIYRKEDGTCRVLLSFQNDGARHADFTEPAVGPGPCLSFGLHLAGRGYRELDMPLDGREGRPTLAEITDGKPHHVVAAYDSFTGSKAIFIDGVRRFEHVYPVGTLVLCGGPATAEIGNTRGGEPFTGVIDEVALYDFALTPDEVAGHWRRVAAGGNYYGSESPAPGSARWQAVTRLVEGRTMTFNQQTGLPR